MATLRIVKSNDASLTGLAIPLDASAYRIGRDPSSDLVIADASVSRRHAVLDATSGNYSIADEGSGNGVWVNGLRVTQRQLADGDSIVIGETTLRFESSAGLEKTVGLELPPSPKPAPTPAPPPAPAASSPQAPTRASGCAIGCLIAAIVLFLFTIAGSFYVLHRAGYLPGL